MQWLRQLSPTKEARERKTGSSNLWCLVPFCSGLQTDQLSNQTSTRRAETASPNAREVAHLVKNHSRLNNWLKKCPQLQGKSRHVTADWPKISSSTTDWTKIRLPKKNSHIYMRIKHQNSTNKGTSAGAERQESTAASLSSFFPQ